MQETTVFPLPDFRTAHTGSRACTRRNRRCARSIWCVHDHGLDDAITKWPVRFDPHQILRHLVHV